MNPNENDQEGPAPESLDEAMMLRRAINAILQRNSEPIITTIAAPGGDTYTIMPDLSPSGKLVLVIACGTEPVFADLCQAMGMERFAKARYHSPYSEFAKSEEALRNWDLVELSVWGRRLDWPVLIPRRFGACRRWIAILRCLLFGPISSC
jgi:hypothetical protein